MRRVAHLIDTTGPGGAETIFLDLVFDLTSRGWESLPVVQGPGWVRDRLQERGFGPPVVTSRRRFDLGYLRRLRRLVVDRRVDLIHAHLRTTTLYGSVVGLASRVPVIGTFHGATDLGAPGPGAWLRHRIIRRGCHRVVFVSASLMNEAIEARGFREEDGTVIWNGIDTELFRPGRSDVVRDELGIGEDQLLIGAVGNVRPAKDYATLLEAAARVEAASPRRVRFIVAGETSHSTFAPLERRLHEENLDEVVRFVGFRTDVPDFLRALDLFVLPSRHEGFSLVTVQALASGLPVVATRCGGPEEILGRPDTGILVPREDPEAMAEAILGLIADPELRRALGERARRRAVEAFATSVMVDAYERLYREALRDGSDSSRMDSYRASTSLA